MGPEMMENKIDSCASIAIKGNTTKGKVKKVEDNGVAV